MWWQPSLSFRYESIASEIGGRTPALFTGRPMPDVTVDLRHRGIVVRLTQGGVAELP